ncbi:MAG: serine hydrolase [Chloroflexota bacterium]
MRKKLLLSFLILLALTGCALRRSGGGAAPTKAASNPNADPSAAFNAAAEYSEKAGGVSMLVWRNGETIFERYPRGSSASDAHVLHSGTKSFSCAMAVSASTDGLLTLDERVADTITEWQGNPQKSQITIRQLISLSSGLSGGVVGETPTYSEALNFKMVGQPGKKFDYGPVPFQVFGELMKRKLGGGSPLDYLDEKVFEPIGLVYESWKFTSDGDPHIPNGAYLTAREWVKYGVLILNVGEWQGQRVLDETLLKECFVGSAANPSYGISFWLPGVEGGDTSPESLDNGTTSGGPDTSIFPDDLLQASGAEGQRLFIIPSLGVVIVRQAEPGLFQGNAGFSDVKFFRLIMPAFAN